MGNLLGGGIFLTILVTCWDKVKGFIWGILGLFICRHTFQDTMCKYGAVYAWDKLKNKKSMAPIYDFRLLGSGAASKIFIREIGFKNFRLVFFGKVPALVTIDARCCATFYSIKPFINHEKMMIQAIQHYDDNYASVEEKLHEKSKKKESRFGASYIRGSLNCEKKDEEELNSSNNTVSGGTRFVYSITFTEAEQLNIGRRVNYDADLFRQYITLTKKDVSLMDNLYLNEEMKSVMNKLDKWFKHKDWFTDRSIQWKRGILLHGEPGTGKTSFIIALAEHFGVPAYIFDLSTFTNNDLERYWNHIKACTPCFVVFEDFDSVFDGRTNVHSEGSVLNKPVSFDCILNVLDGAVKYDGIVTFITTNNIEKIDKSLGGGGQTRPGRIDYVYEMNGIDNEGKKFIAEKIFYDMDNSAELIYKSLEADNIVTPAQFKEHCINAALESYDKE